MIVTFISQCEKKALSRTRRVLDAYANRIGDNVWQTIITEEGLLMVKKLLRRTASKNTAVSCHWIRSRSRSDLLWVVGNRNRFNEMGYVPVNWTMRQIVIEDQENDWYYLPLIKGLVAIAGLLHDWGKCSDLFQEKLIKKSDKFRGDPLRHEWISLLLLQLLVEQSGDCQKDEQWLQLLFKGGWSEKSLIKAMNQRYQENRFKNIENLPPLAQFIAWLIISHHRLPNLKNKNDDGDIAGYSNYSEELAADLTTLWSDISSFWGYENRFDDTFEKRLPKCFKFSHGLLQASLKWQTQLKKWSGRLLQELGKFEEALVDGSWRTILQYARLSLMFGDHYFSSLPIDYHHKSWMPSVPLLANTDRKTGNPRQFLDEHLLGVTHSGLQVAHYLKDLTLEMPYAYDLKKIKTKSPARFAWQDRAVSRVNTFKKRECFKSQQGWFIVNMASTGTGKTIANAKIMQALSEDGDGLRYILALGLRTLTLQTGDSYRENLGMEREDLAVLIGSKAVQELHEDAKSEQQEKEDSVYEEIGSESLESLLDDPLDYVDEQFYPNFMEILFPKDRLSEAEKNRAFLYRPILVCTIDHIMGATETVKGGKYLLPYLRLLSSDLVIDEVDDFGVEDLISLGRLIHLAGMLGRKVMISSATIPPSLAIGFFHAYQKGFKIYSSFYKEKKPIINGMWVDEFHTEIESIYLNDESLEFYRGIHYGYADRRCQNLTKQNVKQKARIIPCEVIPKPLGENEKEQPIERAYFSLIQQNIEEMHYRHHTLDPISGKRISFGVVRVANVNPCVALTHFLLESEWSSGISPKLMAYHSRQILLLRSIQERHLDQVLSRKEKRGEVPVAFHHSIIRQHIDHSSDEELIFVLVATPVEEVGRDHDFDWAIIEPSSMRSIIQLSGRVMRHRSLDNNIQDPNIGLMTLNLRALKGEKSAFIKPGFESKNNNWRLDSKNLFDIIDHQEGILNINAIPRIREREVLNKRGSLADLEHCRIQSMLLSNKVGADSLHGWCDEVWFLTGLPQQFHRFRKSYPETQLFARYCEGTIGFYIKNELGDWVARNEQYDITSFELSKNGESRLWFKRDYRQALMNIGEKQLEGHSDMDIEQLMQRASERYGEIMIPQSDSITDQYFYSDQLGMFKLI